MIAALYVATGGCYFGLPDVDPWDEARDARRYNGPWPVVAHPPCDRWCQMAPVNQARYGHKIGADDGCFAAALAAVRRFGGLYATDDLDVAHAVRAWAIAEAGNPLMRIVLAGYDGEHEMPADWECVEWKAQGGFGNQNDDDEGMGRINSQRERLWFSPACIKPHRDRSLLDLLELTS